MDYTRLSLAELRTELEDIGRTAETTFGRLDSRQLNWRPDATQWSVAQCLDHLLTANRLMRQAALDALDGTGRRSVWQRMPVAPGLFGRMLIRSMSPGATRKFKAAPLATPAASDIASDIVRRTVEQHREASDWVRTLDERTTVGAVMTSPFIRIVTYSVLDGLRLVAAHDRRHLEQALRVTQTPGFPASDTVT